MAEGYIEVSEGSGKKLRSRTRSVSGNTVHEEIIGGDVSHVATYKASTANDIVTATSNSHLLQIMAGATNHVYIRRLRLWLVVAAGTATLSALSIYRLTTAGTGGSAHTASPLDTTDSAAGAALMSLPTSKGTEGVLLATHSMHFPAAITDASTPALVFEETFGDGLSKMLRIPAGTSNGIALKIITGVATAAVVFDAEFIELPY